jgi:hypothetical protein
VGFEELEVAGFDLITCDRAETGRRRISCPTKVVCWAAMYSALGCTIIRECSSSYLLEGQNAGMASHRMAYRRASEARLCFLVTEVDLTIANIRAMQVIELSYTENIQRLKAETSAVNGLCVPTQKIKHLSVVRKLGDPSKRSNTVESTSVTYTPKTGPSRSPHPTYTTSALPSAAIAGFPKHSSARTDTSPALGTAVVSLLWHIP